MFCIYHVIWIITSSPSCATAYAYSKPLLSYQIV